MPEDTSTERKPALGLSVSQLIGGSAAAATAAVLGSRLGVAGTVLGAALVSVVSAVAGSLYTQSLRRTQEMIRAREMLSARELMARAGRTRVLPTIKGSGREPVDAADEEVRAEEIEEAVDDATPSIWSRITWKSVAITAAVVFVIAALVITGTELLTGKSLDGSKGTTVSNVVHGGSHHSAPARTPASSSTPTPSSSSTPLPSRAPLDSISPSPSSTTSAIPSGLPTSTPSGGTTPSGTPTP
jgi:hypothetical protein